MKTPKEAINAATKNECQWLSRLLDKSEPTGRISVNRRSRRTIYRVLDSIREENRGAYTPQLISIGPFHYNSQQLKSMENYKLKFLRIFMSRIEKGEQLASIIEDSEESVRGCYAETIPFDRDTLKQIILMDASFIIEFFLRCCSVESGTDDDYMLLKPWVISRMRLDLILLENQLPFFIVKKLYELLPLDPSMPSFLKLAFQFFGIFNHRGNLPDEPALEQIMHFVDLVRYSYLHPHRSLPKRNFKVVTEMYCASQLAEAGLKFKPSSSRSLLDLKFNEGVLEIPIFTLENAGTEVYARNLVAWEQCHCPDEAYVTDYFVMLDLLINRFNTRKDVDILAQEKINVNNWCPGIKYRDVSDDFYDLCRKLVDFRKKHWYVIMKSNLRQDYFRTPWMGAGTVAAIILLILTLIQTVCTVISIFK